MGRHLVRRAAGPPVHAVLVRESPVVLEDELAFRCPPTGTGREGRREAGTTSEEVLVPWRIKVRYGRTEE